MPLKQGGTAVGQPPEPTIRQVLHKTIKRHAGLSDWDDEPIAEEVTAILRALKRHRFI
jgi:hypothetical protein